MLFLALLAALSGDPTFDEGVKLFDDLEYEQALVRFEAVAQRPDLADEDRATALLYVGLSRAGMGEMEAARSIFAQAISAHRDVALPPNTPPPIVEIVEELRAAAPASPEPPEPQQQQTLASAETAPPAATASFTGVALTIAGSVTSAGAIAFGAIAAATYADAQDKDKFADEARAAVDTANAELVAAGVLAPVGVAMTIAGALMIAAE